MSSSHEEAAAERAASSRERGTVVPTPGGDDVQERASLGEVVLGVTEGVVATGLVGGAKLVAGAVVDKVSGSGGGDHKAEKD
jgi:hypothetical protein